MSNRKELLLRVDNLFDDSEKNRRLKDVIDDLYKNASFKDTVIEEFVPGVESMNDGETKFVDVSGTVRIYRKIGNNLYFTKLEKAPGSDEGNILRVTSFRMSPGGTPGTNIDIFAVGQHKSLPIANASNLIKNGSSGSFSLSSDGTTIKYSPPAGVKIVGHVSWSTEIHDINNSSTTEMYIITGFANTDNKLDIQAIKRGDQLNTDWTTILDAGDQANVSIAYITDN